jgi:hypothetical protein
MYKIIYIFRIVGFFYEKNFRKYDSNNRAQILQSSNCNFEILNIYFIFLH